MTVVLNPATEEPIAEVPGATIEDADRAVEAARRAFPAWRAVAPGDRARLLRGMAALVEEHGEDLARLESRNAGKPITNARGEVGMVAEVFYFYAGGWTSTTVRRSRSRAGSISRSASRSASSA